MTKKLTLYTSVCLLKIAESDQEKPDIILDYAEDGR